MTRLFHLAVALIALFVLAPILVVVAASFSGGDVPQFPPPHPSWRWYAHALGQPALTNAALNSAWLALVATAIATPVAIAAALSIVRGEFPGKALLQALLLAPLFVPAVVISLAILVTSARLGVRDVGLRLVGAHVLVTFPYLVRTIIASLTRFDSTLEDAARTLGASELRTLLKITLPLIRPGIVAGFLFALVVSFDNVSVSLFLTTARTNTLPLAILNYVQYNFDPSIAAVSTMLVTLSAAIAVLLEWVVGLRRVVEGKAA
jgi:putative spermidine/putrescine transport system permease protein